MNKKRNKKVQENLIEAVKNETYSDNNRDLEDVKNKKTFHTKLPPLLLNFIDGELNHLDPKLALHFQNNPFNEITVKRAVLTNKTASEKMIDLLGYYAFKDAWLDVKENYIEVKVKVKEQIEIISDVPSNQSIQENNILDKSTEVKYKPLVYLFLGISTIAAFIFLYPKITKTNLPHRNTCDCNISPATTALSILDSFQYEKIVKLSSDEILLSEVRHLTNSPQINQLSPEILEQESKTFIGKMENDFPEKYDPIFMELLFYQTYFCAMDKMYCKDNSLLDSNRLSSRENNYYHYSLKIGEIINQHRDTNTNTNVSPFDKKLIKDSSKISKNKDIQEKKNTIKKDPIKFHLKGLNANTILLLKKSIVEYTQLEYSSSKNVDYVFSFESSNGIIQNQEAQDFYYAPEAYLAIYINGDSLCGNIEEESFRLPGVHSPGNHKHQTKQELNKQINQIIQSNHLEIVQLIKECLEQ